MKKIIGLAYGGYFLGVLSMGALGYLWWKKYGQFVQDVTDETVVTRNGRHVMSDLERHG